MPHTRIHPYAHTLMFPHLLTIDSSHSDEWEGEQAAVQLLHVRQELDQLLSVHSHHEGEVEAQGVVPTLRHGHQSRGILMAAVQSTNLHCTIKLFS